MAVNINVKLDGLDALNAKLRKMATTDATKAMKATMNDLSKRVPSAVAKVAAQTYALPASRFNPNSKGGKGSLSVGGNTVASMSWTWRGSRLSIGTAQGFKMTPKAWRMKPFTLTTEILRGRKSKFGHWNKPWSEGGAYGKQSPWMALPGMEGAYMRQGKGLGDRARGLSVPQMILSDRHENTLRQKIQETAINRLEHNVQRYLGE